MFIFCASYVCYVPDSSLTTWVTGHAFIDLPTSTGPSASNTFSPKVHEIIQQSPIMGYAM